MSKPTRITNSIRALRFTHGEMTQAQLAERVGVTRNTPAIWKAISSEGE